MEKENPEKKNIKKKVLRPKFSVKGLNIDKAEYQEIILSNSNHPERKF